MLLHPLTGVLLFCGGLIGYFIEYGAFHILRTPYTFLIPASLGSGILISATRIRPTIARGALAVILTALTLMVWWLTLVAWRTPTYKDPAHPGQTAPSFSVSLADGTTFNTASLKGDSHSLLVFYRGRW